MTVCPELECIRVLVGSDTGDRPGRRCRAGSREGRDSGSQAEHVLRHGSGDYSGAGRVDARSHRTHIVTRCNEVLRDNVHLADSLSSTYTRMTYLGRLCAVDALEQTAYLLRHASFPVCLTGAGISTASGIPDFRSPDTGLWTKVDPMKAASIDAFLDDPVEFWSFYRHRLGALDTAEPNPAHYALARLEKAGYLKALITQNIDRLHRRAGSNAIAEVHGSIDTAVCLSCGRKYPHDRMVEALVEPKGLPRCDCGRILKPGVIFFGEALPDDQYALAVSWAQRADVMLVAGSSLVVWPVAGLPDITLSSGGKLIILTASETPYDQRATIVDARPLEEILPLLADMLGA